MIIFLQEQFFIYVYIFMLVYVAKFGTSVITNDCLSFS